MQAIVETAAAELLEKGELSAQAVRGILGRQGREARRRGGFFGLGRY